MRRKSLSDVYDLWLPSAWNILHNQWSWLILMLAHYAYFHTRGCVCQWFYSVLLAAFCGGTFVLHMEYGPVQWRWKNIFIYGSHFWWRRGRSRMLLHVDFVWSLHLGNKASLAHANVLSVMKQTGRRRGRRGRRGGRKLLCRQEIRRVRTNCISSILDIARCFRSLTPRFLSLFRPGFSF